MSMEAEAAEIEAAILELAQQFACAAGRDADAAPGFMRRARKMVESGWNRRCFTCENRT